MSSDFFSKCYKRLRINRLAPPSLPETSYRHRDKSSRPWAPRFPFLRSTHRPVQMINVLIRPRKYKGSEIRGRVTTWKVLWALRDLNPRPADYESASHVQNNRKPTCFRGFLLAYVQFVSSACCSPTTIPMFRALRPLVACLFDLDSEQVPQVLKKAMRHLLPKRDLEPNSPHSGNQKGGETVASYFIKTIFLASTNLSALMRRKYTPLGRAEPSNLTV